MSDIFVDTSGKKYKRPKDVAVEWRLSVYAFIQNGQGDVLTVVPTWNNLYELPGGGVEFGETIISGLIREVYEETGYRVDVIDFIPAASIHEENWFHLHHNKYYQSLILIYRCRLRSVKQNLKIVNTKDGNEINKILWVPREKFNKRNTHRIAFGLLKELI